MCCEMADFPENSRIWYKDALMAIVHVQRLITFEAIDIFIQKCDFYEAKLLSVTEIPDEHFVSLIWPQAVML